MTPDTAEKFLVETQVAEACEAAGRPELAERIEVVWSSRAVARLGVACRRTFRITLASRSWEVLSIPERCETVFHEVAHLAAFLEGGLEAWGHGPVWRRVMARIGYPEANRLSSVEAARALAPLRRKVIRHIARCSCSSFTGSAPRYRRSDGSHLLTAQKAAKVRTCGPRSSYRCRSCGKPIVLTGEVVKV